MGKDKVRASTTRRRRRWIREQRARARIQYYSQRAMGLLAHLLLLVVQLLPAMAATASVSSSSLSGAGTTLLRRLQAAGAGTTLAPPKGECQCSLAGSADATHDWSGTPTPVTAAACAAVPACAAGNGGGTGVPDGVPLGIATMQECCAICAGLPDCTWFQLGEPAPLQGGMCWVKSGCTTRPSAGCASSPGDARLGAEVDPRFRADRKYCSVANELDESSWVFSSFMAAAAVCYLAGGMYLGHRTGKKHGGTALGVVELHPHAEALKQLPRLVADGVKFTKERVDSMRSGGGSYEAVGAAQKHQIPKTKDQKEQGGSASGTDSGTGDD